MVVFRCGRKSISLDVDRSWSVLFLKQRVCMELDCDPHAHFFASNGTVLNDWEKVSRYDSIFWGNNEVEVLSHSSSEHLYVFCYPCDRVVPATFTAVCGECSSSNFSVAGNIAHPEIKILDGLCETCEHDIAKVSICCSEDPSHSPAFFLRHVFKNLDSTACVACYSPSEVAIKFCENAAHALCLDCFRRYAESHLSDAKFSIVPGLGCTLACPLGCSNSYISDTHLFRILGRTFYSRYKDLAARLFCYMEGLFTCPNCSSFWEKPENPSLSTIFTCEGPHGCGVEFCYRCRAVFSHRDDLSNCSCSFEGSQNENLASKIGHPGISKIWSAVKIDASDLASSSLIASTCKTCPRCHSQTNKDGGCNHMTCSICSYEWCWICHMEWSKDCQLTHWF